MDAEIPTMFVLAMLSVGMWTLRVAIAAQGMKIACAVIAAAEAVVFALTFSHLVTDLASPGRLIGYAVGVAAGTALGLVVNDRLTPGHTELQLIAPGHRSGLVDSLHDQGWPATWSEASGPSGPVTMVWLSVDDSDVPRLVGDVRDLAPEAFWTLQRLRTAAPSPVPNGFRQVHARRGV
jgi:uncharacterized protein YebE (UPF0316 family)